jgi:hypothetical protein
MRAIFNMALAVACTLAAYFLFLGGAALAGMTSGPA